MTQAIAHEVKSTLAKQPNCKIIPIDAQDVSEDITLRQWLETQAKKHKLTFMLAHADDGVIWGKFLENAMLKTADEVFSNLPVLKLSTLRQCRLFGAAAEVMLWRVDEDHNAQQSWKARSINDENLSNEDFITEDQILWGTQQEGVKEGFTRVADGAEGLRHTVPLTDILFAEDRTTLFRPLRLKVRHYIDYDSDGVARIYLSRLVTVTTHAQGG